MEVLIAFVVGLVAFVVFWGVGVGAMESLLILVAILLIGVFVRMMLASRGAGEDR